MPSPSRSTPSKPKVSVVVTVLNEAHTITQLLNSLAAQTHLADELIVVDGGSTDQTLQILKNTAATLPQLRVLSQPGNRSLGRNHGIQQATHELIAITDAGCTPHPDWLEQLLQAYLGATNSQTVIAGFYDAEPATPFEAAVVPYALVMPDRVDPKTFLPATRSMLMPRVVWQQVGGFDPNLSDNEDYDFARRLVAAKTPLMFAESAKVTWQPRSTLKQFWTMIFRFARGDAFAGWWRPKVGRIFGRYLVGLGLILIWLCLNQPIFLYLAVIGILGYSLWSIKKNARYVGAGWRWLPILQLVSDVAVMMGTVTGMAQKINNEYQTRETQNRR